MVKYNIKLFNWQLMIGCVPTSAC